VISCVCVTQPGREDFLRQAVADFHDQDLPSEERELIVVGDPKDGTSLGELRNRAIAKASGDFVATWDDDDRHHPDRLQLQIADILRTGKATSFLAEISMECACGAVVKSHHRKGGWECTMVARRHHLRPYPPVDVAEDRMMIDKMFAMGSESIVRSGSPDLYLKKYHGGNTIDRAGHAILFRRAGHMCRSLARVGDA